METCDVLIVGGGPAGSACAWRLARAGREVVVLDAAAFPRDKVCAGWITPQVVADLDLDLDDYGRGRTLQPITGFRTGLIGGGSEVETVYDRPVSYGIRRCEFDHYLLQRSGAGLRLGASISGIRRDREMWIVNDAVAAPMLVGAGGHFCPVARLLGPRIADAPLVVAQETEFAIAPSEEALFTTAPSTPELYFSRDLKGYGWCFRKQHYLNVGFGSLDRRLLPHATRAFVSFLQARGKVPAAATWPWHGHAYLLSEPPTRRVLDDGVVLVGDAAGLAYPQSGEGIRPAIESGLMAAAAIVQAGGRCTRERLAPYESGLRRRFGLRPLARLASHTVPAALAAAIAPALFDRSWFVRRMLLDRWFLHAHDRALSAA
jgi:geranylgeranyl reductase family protein